MKTITREIVEQTVRNALPGLAFDVPGDVLAGLERALEIEEDPRASEALRLLVENARIASEDRVAICQDTGSVWICLEAGPDVAVAGDALSGVNDAVAAVYTDCRLRKSLVRDALFGPVTPQVPASILQFHPDVTVVLDREAAACL